MENKYSGLTSCLSGEVICKQPLIQPLLLQLKSLVSAPPDIYQELYLATFTAFAEFCQAMPFDVQQPESNSLLQRQLELAITALKLRRGRMLPQHSESELIAEQEPLWTYAVFTACLFTGLTRLQQDRTVELYLNNNEKIGQWSVLAGNLFEPETYYRINSPAAGQTLVSSDNCSALLIGKIIPCCAMRWLASYPYVFSSWWQAITQDRNVEKKDGLILLVQEAADKIDYFYREAVIPIEKLIDKIDNTPSANQVLEHISLWLQQQCKANGCDAERDLLLRIPLGLFIDIKRIADFLTLYPKYSSQDNLLQHLDDYLVKENYSVLHRYRSARFEKRLVLDGVILQEIYLPPLVKSLPMQSSFVPEIPL